LKRPTASSRERCARRWTCRRWTTARWTAYALRVQDVKHGRLKVKQRIQAGAIGGPLEPGTAARIFTGAPIPPGADAVVMQEHCEVRGDEVLIKKAPEAGELDPACRQRRAQRRRNPAGRQAPPSSGHGLAASVGIKTLPVFRRIRLGLFFTGDELVMPGEPLAPGRIYNSNRFTLRGLAEVFGCEVRDYGIVPDSLGATREVLGRAAGECDLIVTSGGVSVGDADYVKPAVEAEGALLMWKIAMKPGRPLAFGSIRQAFFIGLPGNPVSSFVTFLIFVRPFLLKTQGATDVMPRAVAARAGFCVAAARCPAGVPARKMERAGRAGSLSDAGFGGAHLHGVGRRPGRQPAASRDQEGRHGSLPGLLGAVSVKVTVRSSPA